jgi:hypothetical protein
MAHGYGDGLTTLYDEDGNPVSVTLEANGAYAIATRDERTVRLLAMILERLTESEPVNAWTGAHKASSRY